MGKPRIGGKTVGPGEGFPALMRIMREGYLTEKQRNGDAGPVAVGTVTFVDFGSVDNGNAQEVAADSAGAISSEVHLRVVPAADPNSIA